MRLHVAYLFCSQQCQSNTTEEGGEEVGELLGNVVSTWVKAGEHTEGLPPCA